MNGKLDQVAAGLSLICVVHCVVPLVLVLPFFSLSSLQAGAAGDDWLHLILFGVGVPFSLLAFYGVSASHRRPQFVVLIVLGFALLGSALLVGDNLHMLLTLSGATLVAIGHLIHLVGYRKAL